MQYLVNGIPMYISSYKCHGRYIQWRGQYMQQGKRMFVYLGTTDPRDRYTAIPVHKYARKPKSHQNAKTR